MKTVLALVGAIVGGVLGFFATGWLATQGFYSIILPGALAGLGTFLGRFSNFWIPILIGLLAMGLIYFTEWHNFPFKADRSLSYFVENLSQLKPMTHIMAIIGGLFAFWFPFRNRRPKPQN